jgi:hypothetical protein
MEVHFKRGLEAGKAHASGAKKGLSSATKEPASGGMTFVDMLLACGVEPSGKRVRV